MFGFLGNKKPTEVYILVVLLVLVGVGAVVAGVGFVLAPEGTNLGMSSTWLETSPFPNYLIPGLFLLFINGLLSLSVAFALWKKPSWKYLETLNFFSDMYWAWSFSIYIGIILMLWIVAQMIWIPYSILQPTVAFWGAAIIFVSILPQVRMYFRK